MNIFFERLNQLFLERKATQEAIRGFVGVSQPTVGRWLAGEQYPRADELDRLADYFQVTTDELMGRSPVDYSVLHEVAIPPDQKKVIAKLRRQVQNMQTQINAINETLKELDPPCTSRIAPPATTL